MSRQSDLLSDATTHPAPDPYDPASLRLPTDFGAAVGVKKILTQIPVRKPDKSWFVRVHPDPAYRLTTAVVELKEDRETYLVAPALWPDLAGEATFSARALYMSVNRQGVPFIWPLRLPDPDGKLDAWGTSLIDAAHMASERWVRVAANMAAGCYDVWVATGELGEPTWPDTPYRDLLQIAFRDRLIGTLDHPVLRRLRGEI
jgi:hypothetical protein